MGRPSRLRDVAQYAGVSVSVVSRILSNDPSLRVRETTRSRVLRAASSLRYTQHYAGRALRLHRSGAIALLIPDVTNPISAEICQGVEETAAEADLVVLLGRSDWLETRNNIAVRLAQQGRVDGLLVQLRDEDSIECLGLLPTEVPVVLISSQPANAASSVAIDDGEAARVATSFLLGLGHRSVGLVGGLPNTGSARVREAGFRRALADAGLDCQNNCITRFGYSPEAGRLAFEHLGQAAPLPTALVVANVDAAIGVLSAARNRGIAIPETLSLVAIHDTWLAAHVSPPLTAVRLPTRELGRTAAQLLVRALEEGGQNHLLIDVPPLLVPRQSHAAPTLRDLPAR